MKKTLLLIIALTIVGNANTASCVLDLKNIENSIAKARNFLVNDMESSAKAELKNTKRIATKALVNCDDKVAKDFALKAIIVAEGFSK